MELGTGLQVRLRQATPFALDVAFEAPGGEITALFGPSGSGKTTVLRAIAGLQPMDTGRVACAGEVWTDTVAGIRAPTHRPPVGFVFQDYALFPHLTVREQLALSLGHRPTGERPARIDVLLDLVRLQERLPLDIWMDVGRLEWLLEANRAFYRLLVSRSYQPAYREYSGGHNYTAWRDDLWHGLVHLFGMQP